jgi:hypothetical protein
MNKADTVNMPVLTSSRHANSSLFFFSHGLLSRVNSGDVIVIRSFSTPSKDSEHFFLPRVLPVGMSYCSTVVHIVATL